MMIRKKISKGKIVRTVRQGGGGKKATSIKTTLSCGHARRGGGAHERKAEERAREILRELAGVGRMPRKGR